MSATVVCELIAFDINTDKTKETKLAETGISFVARCVQCLTERSEASLSANKLHQSLRCLGGDHKAATMGCWSVMYGY